MSRETKIEKAKRLIKEDKIKPITSPKEYVVSGDTKDYRVLIWDDGDARCPCEYMQDKATHDQERWCSHALAAATLRKINRMKFGRK